MPTDIKNIMETDVLVVGGGDAGCWAAIRARELTPRVTLVDKGMVSRSGDMLYCHNTLAPMAEEELEGWLTDWVEHTEYLSDQEYLEIMLKDGGPRIYDLIAWGAPFELDEKGDLLRDVGRGHRVSRVVRYDGRKLMEVMRKEILARGINLVERVMVTDLLSSDGQVTGALGIHTRTGEFVIFKAKAVVIATGLFSPKLHFSYADNLTGDGQAMALRAGAELTDLEFSFSANFTAYKNGQMLCVSLIQFQTLSCYLVNGRGERFMDKYAGERRERCSHIGFLAQGITKEIMEGRGPVYFDMRHYTREEHEHARRIIPVTIAALETAGIDITKEMVECQPTVTTLGGHGSGGIKIDLWGQTNVPGLLAAGICSKFPGCSEVLSGGFVSIANVFGHRAGERAAEFAKGQGPLPLDKGQVERLQKQFLAPLNRKKGIRPEQVYRPITSKLIRPEFGIIKNEGTTKEMLNEIKRTHQEELPRVAARDVHELIKANEARNFVELVEPVYICALERKESRLIHYRRDYPYRDDLDWLKWVVLKKEGDVIKVRHEPVPVEKNRIKLKERRRIPSPVQFS